MTERCCEWEEPEDPHDCCTCFDAKFVLSPDCRCLSCYEEPCPDCTPKGDTP